jgi:phytoene dehydrogenase-like protein
MERRARELGVQFHYDTPVQSIVTEPLRRGKHRVRGIGVEGEERPYEIVVSNVDVKPTYEELLDDTDAPLYQRYRQLEPSSSGLVFYWGMTRVFPQLGLHNIFFSDDYRLEFRQIFDELRCPGDPTVYVNITSRICPEDAPPDHENWFVLINAPHEAGQDWAAETARVRAGVLERLSGILGVNLEEHIAAEATMTPRDIQERTGSAHGSLYGISSNSRNAAFLRHRNRSVRHRGLYFCGGSAHPGGGMPLVVLSARIVADLILRRAGRRDAPGEKKTDGEEEHGQTEGRAR